MKATDQCFDVLCVYCMLCEGAEAIKLVPLNVQVRKCGPVNGTAMQCEPSALNACLLIWA